MFLLFFLYFTNITLGYLTCKFLTGHYNKRNGISNIDLQIVVKQQFSLLYTKRKIFQNYFKEILCHFHRNNMCYNIYEMLVHSLLNIPACTCPWNE